jgi:hypothetical protein
LIGKLLIGYVDNTRPLSLEEKQKVQDGFSMPAPRPPKKSVTSSPPLLVTQQEPEEEDEEEVVNHWGKGTDNPN